MFAKHRRVFFGIISVLVILACSMPSFLPDSNIDTDATVAAILANITVVSTETFPPTLTPAQPPTLTMTPLISDTPAATSTAIFLASPTSSIPRITVSMDTNCRTGPGKSYPTVGALLENRPVEVFAMDPTWSYWYIRNPSIPDAFCWVWGEYAVVTGDTDLLPVYTPAPTSTPPPEFQFTYANKDSCVGYWVRFIIKNVGSMTFESISMDVKDITDSLSVTSVYNEFSTIRGCGGAKKTDPLKPGETVTVNSPPFTSPLGAHKFKATITLCTEDGLAGTCVSQTITFRVN